MSDLVLRILWVSGSERESILQVLFRRNLVTLLIFQLQAEVTEDPEEVRKYSSQVLATFCPSVITLAAHHFCLDMLCKVHDEAQTLNCGFVDLAHRVIDEEA